MAILIGVDVWLCKRGVNGKGMKRIFLSGVCMFLCDERVWT